MCVAHNPNGYTPRDFAKEGYINKGPSMLPGFTSWEKPASTTTNSSLPQPSGGIPAYGDMQQQLQDLQASVPKETQRRFSFNNGNFRIADSSMDSSDSGLNV